MAAYEGQALPATLVECALEEDERIVLVGTDPDDLSRDMRPGAPLTLIFEPTATGDALVRIFKAGTT